MTQQMNFVTDELCQNSWRTHRLIKMGNGRLSMGDTAKGKSRKGEEGKKEREESEWEKEREGKEGGEEKKRSREQRRKRQCPML